MKNKLKQISQKSTFWLGAVILGVTIGVTLQFVRAAWNEPLAGTTPPAGNVEAPLNTSNIGQYKVGGLNLNSGGAPVGLIVENGNVGIGTPIPNNTKTNIIDVKDAWIRDANSGDGQWASELGVGNLGQGTIPPVNGTNSDCYWVNPALSRWHYDICSAGYYVRGINFQANNDWDAGNTLCCKIDTNMPTYCPNNMKSGDIAYSDWGGCVGNNVCGISTFNPPNPNDCWEKTAGGTGTQKRTRTVCNADGTITTSTESQSCSPAGLHCGSTTYSGWCNEEGGPVPCTLPNCYDPWDPNVRGG